MELNTIFMLSALLFTIGLCGTLLRKNLMIVFLSIEIMLNSTVLIWISFARVYQDSFGRIMVLFVLTLAACEAAVGLALLLLLHRHYHTLDSDKLNALRG